MEKKPNIGSYGVALLAAFALAIGSARFARAEEGDAASVAATTTAKGEPKDEEERAKDPAREVIAPRRVSLTLSTGVSRTLEFDFDIGPIFVTDSTLFDYRRVKDGDRERRLVLVPKNSGYTDLTIHDSNGTARVTYNVQVTREDMGRVISQLEELLGDIEGLKIKTVGGTLILDGEILLPKDMIRIMRVVAAMKDRDPKKKEVNIKNLATISKMTMNILAERIEREIGSPEITSRVVNNNIFLEGTAESDFEADRAVEIAKTYLPEVFIEPTKGEGGEVKPKAAGGTGGLPAIVDLLRVRPRQASPPAQDIKITVDYVELNNEYEKTFNFEWKPLAGDSSTIKYDSALGELSASLVATVSNLFPKLVTARSHQHARVLKEESIIVKDRSDVPSVIESSIKLYSRIVNEKGEASLQEIPVQNVTKVRAATIPGSDSIDLGVQISLNSLLGQNSGAPIIATNSLQTQVTVKNGDSAALGGYAVDSALSGYNREPTRSVGNAQSGSSSPLFNLSRSKSFRRDKQQYIIFVTPEILRTASAGTEDLTRKFRLNGGER
jgi:pilus assembly protein CpaC